MTKSGRRRSKPASLPLPGVQVARVLPAVGGIDKEFDYALPEGQAGVRSGSMVRVDLHGRRVGGWVTEVGVDPPGGLALREIAKVRGWGPEPELVGLAEWAAVRWAGRRSSFLSTASPENAVVRLPPRRSRPPAEPGDGGFAGAVAGTPAGSVRVLRLPPAADPTPLIAAAAQRGPTLVVIPSASRASVLAARLRHAGGDVALLPGDWPQARAGAAVVVGTRAAAWGPCPGLAAAVVVDAHDESLGQEQAPTWHAAAVVAERARRAGAPLFLVSPCPSVEMLHQGGLVEPDKSTERRGWAALEVLDRRGDDPRLGLYPDRLVQLVRGSKKVACVLNRTGRARLLACASCGELARCERCDSALAQNPADPGLLACPSCGLGRPSVCASCGSTVLRQLRVGVTRAREELEILAGRPVGEVTASTAGLPREDVLVGTEALLRRLAPADGFDTVVFADFDQELLAPRVRAGQEALGMLATASRVVGGRGGRVVVQTRLPEHPVVRSALLADPSILTDWDSGLRSALRFPPFASVAVLSGEAAGEYATALSASGAPHVEVSGPRDGEWLVRAADQDALGDALASVPRPEGRLRVAVEPARL